MELPIRHANERGGDISSLLLVPLTESSLDAQNVQQGLD